MDTNGNTWTSEDVKLVEKFIEIKNRGFYVNGRELTDAYNRILHKKAAPTNCGSCLRQRVSELEGALNHFKALEAKKQEEVDNTKEEVKEAVTETRNNLKSKRKK